MMKAEVVSTGPQPQQTKSDKLTVQFQAHCLLEERLITCSKALFVLSLLAVLCTCSAFGSS